MTGLAVGQTAPGFRLPSAQGSDVALDDYRGRKNVVVWFTKGMACVFCRQHMSQLARAYPRFQKLDAEVLEITPSTVERARFYARRYALPFPYLCDPDDQVRRAWHVDVRPTSLGYRVKGFVHGITAPKPESDFPGKDRPTFRELGTLLRDEDMGFFIVDREGIVRYTYAGSYVTPDGPTLIRPIPSTDEIMRELETSPDVRSA